MSLILFCVIIFTQNQVVRYGKSFHVKSNCTDQDFTTLMKNPCSEIVTSYLHCFSEYIRTAQKIIKFKICRFQNRELLEELIAKAHTNVPIEILLQKKILESFQERKSVIKLKANTYLCPGSHITPETVRGYQSSIITCWPCFNIKHLHPDETNSYQTQPSHSYIPRKHSVGGGNNF